MESHLAGSTFSSTQVTTANGIVEGTTEASSGIRMFKGIPFAAPPVGELRQNIAAFGGDPERVTIAGESAGSISVSAQMVSPLAKDLVAGTIGSSGSLMGTLSPISLAEAEQNGIAFASGIGATSLAALRALPAAQLLEATATVPLGQFVATVDGYFLPRPIEEIFAAGELREQLACRGLAHQVMAEENSGQHQVIIKL